MHILFYGCIMDSVCYPKHLSFSFTLFTVSFYCVFISYIYLLQFTDTQGLYFLLNFPAFFLSYYMYTCAKSLQSCLTLCDSVYCRPPGSSIHEIIQASILNRVAMPFFRGSSQPKDRTHISCISCIGRVVLYHQYDLGSPISLWEGSKYSLSFCKCSLGFVK